jgi:hypothetical protein
LPPFDGGGCGQFTARFISVHWEGGILPPKNQHTATVNILVNTGKAKKDLDNFAAAVGKSMVKMKKMVSRIPPGLQRFFFRSK